MFDIADEKQEATRSQWYAPIGEYVLLFSNLEFMLSGWIGLLSNSRALKNVKNTLLFSRQLELLLDVIDEYQVDEKLKEQWKCEWQKAKSLVNTRNLICHNPPIDNFSLSFEEHSVLLKSRVVEILTLKKPLGEPGSGLSLTELKKQTNDLRSLLIRLDELHTHEILRQDHLS